MGVVIAAGSLLGVDTVIAGGVTAVVTAVGD
jgi:hypothetical protein